MLAAIEVLLRFKQIIGIISDQGNIRSISIQAADKDLWPWREAHLSSILALSGISH